MIIGDKVKYTREFCRSIGALTGYIPHARGVVVDITAFKSGLTLVNVLWDNSNQPIRVNIDNLTLISNPEVA